MGTEQNAAHEKVYKPPKHLHDDSFIPNLKKQFLIQI